MRKVIKVKALENYNLELTFDNGAVKIKDMKIHLNEGVFKVLKKKELFNSVKLSCGAISWNNDIDLCADYLYETSQEIKNN